MTIARLNLSHGDFETHADAIDTVRKASHELKVPVGIMVDVPGRKYRTGPLAPGVIELVKGGAIILTSESIIGDQDRISVSPPGIHRDAKVGGPILLDDGLLELQVTAVEGEDVRCEIVIGGRVTERRGVTTPGRSPSQPFLDDRAKETLAFAADQKADFVALSTVTGGQDLRQGRQYLREHGSEAQLISKIEMAEALERFDEILEESDAVMVARGDMGVEVPLARVPVIQKNLISRCNVSGKPVITATQMLESMVRSPVPTRAEVTDVANAIYDGTDAIMLSGETSVGQHPVETVKVMCQVALEAEGALPYESLIREKWGLTESKTDDSISYDAVRSGYQLNASVIVAFTESGATAGRVSKYRPKAPILALTPHEDIQRRMTIRWGVTPIIVPEIRTVDGFFTSGREAACEFANLESGAIVVLVAGVSIGVSGGTDLLHVMEIS
jgi:pyruvate kinase